MTKKFIIYSNIKTKSIWDIVKIIGVINFYKHTHILINSSNGNKPRTHLLSLAFL